MPSTRPPIRRLMAIDREIRSGTFPNVPRLAESLRVSPRTVTRALEFLRDSLNAPLEWSAPDNGYGYSELGFVLPLEPATEGELLTFLFEEKVLKDCAGTPLEAVLQRILDKVEAALPHRVSIPARELAEAVSSAGAAAPPNRSGSLRELEAAIHDAVTLEVLYHTESRDVTQWRKIDPYHLAHVDGEWYLLGFCHIHGHVRVFRPSRMRQIKRTRAGFEIPGTFDAIHFLKTRFPALSGDDPISIRVRFDRSLAARVGERKWTPAHRVQYLTDGGAELTLAADDVDGVIRWVLTWGAGVEILSPPWVRRRMREVLKRLAARYSRQTAGPATRSAPPSDGDNRSRQGLKKVYKPPSGRPR